MQKKSNPTPNNTSDWEKNLKKQAQMELMKKIALWGGIVLACVAGLAILVKLAGNSGPSTTPVANPKLRAVSVDKDIVLGTPTAKVTVVEYADFQCPACASYNPVVNQVLQNYKGQVRVVYRYFPLTGIHKNSHISGQAGYAAWKLRKFEEMKDELFTNQKDWEDLGDPRDVFTEYAKSVGMDEAKFKEIMNSKEAADVVNTSEAEALNLGLNSTPSFFIGNKQFTPAGYESFKSLIDDELKSGSGQTSGEISIIPTAKPTARPLQ